MKNLEPIKLGRLAGIPVDFHPIGLLYLTLGTLILGLGAWAAEPVTDPLVKWLLAGVAVGLMAISVILHELGHIIVAAHYKIPLRQTTLYPFGGIFQMSNTPIPARPFALMILAGPMASLVQAIIWLTLWVQTGYTVCLWLAQFNGAMTLLNLMPIASLDSGHLLKLLGHSFLPAQWASLIGFLSSAYLPLGFTLAGGANLLFGLFLPDVVWLMAGSLLVLTGLILQAAPADVILLSTSDRLKKRGRTSAAALYKQVTVQNYFGEG